MNNCTFTDMLPFPYLFIIIIFIGLFILEMVDRIHNYIKKD